MTSDGAHGDPPDLDSGLQGERALGDRRVFPIGLGAMNLSLDGGPSRADAIRTVHAALDAGVQLIDTADVYAPSADAVGHNEALIADALLADAIGARTDVLVATKGGVRRRGEEWLHDGRPAHLRAACEASLRRLHVDCVGLYYLHAVDERVPIEESVGAIERLREEGKVRAIGVSNVDARSLERAASAAPIVAVQNPAGPHHPGWRDDGVLAWCEAHGAAYVAHSPMGGWRAGETAHRPALRQLADELGWTPYDVVLAWLLSESDAVIPIPGASRPENARASAAAASARLTPAQRERVRG